MSKKQTSQDADQLEVVGEVIESAEGFFHKYKNVLIYGLVGIIVIIGGYFGYTELISKPKQREANEQMFQAEKYFAIDSFRLALNGDGNALGFIQVIDNYGSTDAGNLAHFYAGVCYYNLDEYQTAIDHMNKFNSNDELIGARALCVIGDAYVELGQLDNAVKFFMKAANLKSNQYSAMYLMKAARVHEANNKYSDALALYEKIKTDFSTSTEARDIDKYIERAKTLMGA